MKPVRDLLKHSSIDMIGLILRCLACVLLLPFYTTMLMPDADHNSLCVWHGMEDAWPEAVINETDVEAKELVGISS